MSEDKRNHLIKSDYGSYDYFKAFKKDNPEIEISGTEYGKIIREFNDYQRERIATKGAQILFPCGLGKAELRKVKTEVKINDEGEIEDNLPVNWKETRKLWRENPEAREKNIRIKFTNEHSNGYTFRIYYIKSRSKFKNKTIYKLRFNRDLKRNLSESIFKGRIDAFINKF